MVLDAILAVMDSMMAVTFFMRGDWDFALLSLVGAFVLGSTFCLKVIGKW